MADDCRTPGTNVINVLIPINIPHTRTLYRVEHYWLPTNRFEGTDWRVNTSRHQLLKKVKHQSMKHPEPWAKMMTR